MTTTTTIEVQLAAISESSINAEIKMATAAALSGLGFDRWIFVSENPKSLFGLFTLSTGYAAQWFGKYMAKGYMQVDPIVKHCRESSEPLLWDAAEGWDNAEPRVKVFMQDVSASGFGSGLAIPLRSPGGLSGVLSLVSDRPLSEMREEYLQRMDTARAIGKAVHSALERIVSN